MNKIALKSSIDFIHDSSEANPIEISDRGPVHRDQICTSSPIVWNAAAIAGTPEFRGILEHAAGVLQVPGCALPPVSPLTWSSQASRQSYQGPYSGFPSRNLSGPMDVFLAVSLENSISKSAICLVKRVDGMIMSSQYALATVQQ